VQNSDVQGDSKWITNTINLDSCHITSVQEVTVPSEKDGYAVSTYELYH
jgi:hypothetical protein